MVTTPEILWGLLLPAIVAVVAIVIGRMAQHEKRQAAPWAIALAISGGFAVSFVAIYGSISIPPHNAQQVLALMGIAALIVSIIATFVPDPTWPIILSIVLVTGTAFAVTWRRASISGPEFRNVAIIACAAAAFWGGAMNILALKLRGGLLPFLLSGVFGAAALVLANNGTAQLAKVEGAVGLILLVIAVMSFWLNELSLARGGILALEIAGLGTLWCGYLFADVSAVDVILLSAAPLLAWLAVMPGIRSWRPWMRFVFCVVLVLGVVAIAVVPAAQGIRKTMNEQLKSTEY